VAHCSPLYAANPGILRPSCCPVCYASVHFLDGRLRIAAADVHWGSGFAVLGKLFERYAEPATLLDSFLALFGVGLLLATVRWRTGSIAACMGMHAAWVCIIAFVRKTSQVNPDAPANWMVGSYDGVIGWGALGWIGLTLLLYWRLGSANDRQRSSTRVRT
jgi:uncharacterized protein